MRDEDEVKTTDENTRALAVSGGDEAYIKPALHDLDKLAVKQAEGQFKILYIKPALHDLDKLAVKQAEGQFKIFSSLQTARFAKDLALISQSASYAQNVALELSETLSRIGLAQAPALSLLNEEFAKINAGRVLAAEQFQAMYQQTQFIHRQFIDSMSSLFELRLVANIIFSDITKNITPIINSAFDISTILTATQITETTLLAFDEPRLSYDDNPALSAIATQRTTNEIVVQERTSKIELILSANDRQTNLLTEMRGELSDVRAVVTALVQQGQQHITVHDMKYSPDSFMLKIKGIKNRRITAMRQRQLCELLLSDTDAMLQKWDIEAMLDHIGEGFTVDMFEYKRWLNMFYQAARRLNAELLAELGYELILVDRKSEILYVNPRFYHN